MSRPLFSAPGRADFIVALPMVLGAALLAAAPPIHARLTFADYQVLPSDRTVDLLIWMAPDDPARPAFTRRKPAPVLAPGEGFSAPAADTHSPSTDSVSPPLSSAGQACAQGGEVWRIVSCRVSEPRPDPGPMEHHLHWAFLNLGATTRRIDLTAREEHRPTLDSLARPLIAFWRRKDSCDYLVLHQDSYAPAAAGRLACPDLATALSGLEIDLADRMNRPRRLHVSPEEKLVRSPPTRYLHGPQFLSAGVDAMVSFPIMISSEEKFDLDDLASYAIPPLAVNLFFTYRRTMGFRIGYEYARLELEPSFMSWLRSELMTAYSLRLDDWRIRRHTYSGEVMVGKEIQGRGARIYAGYLLGLSRTYYRETATVEGETEAVDGFLKDAAALLLGGQVRVLFKDWFQVGVETGLCIKEFVLRANGQEPDGSASEFQFRLSLGLQKDLHLGPKE